MNLNSGGTRSIGAVLAGLVLCTITACSSNVDVAATGTAPATAVHLWITVQEVWFATAADTPPDATTGWVKEALPAPVTVDLATITPGTLASLASQLSIPAGTYQQVHLVAADSADPLLASASTAGLQYNTAISLTDASGTVSVAPLEWSVPGAGVTIATSLDITGTLTVDQSSSTTGTTAAGSTSTTATGTTSASTATTTTLAVSLDGARDVLTYTYGSNTGYLLSAIATVVDESRAGGISGQVDMTLLPTGHPVVTVSAEVPDATGTHHVVVARRLAGADGTFSLYPLPAPTTGSTNYDVVITCAGASTVIVRGVPVSAGAVGSSTALQAGAIELSAVPTVYADLGGQTPLLPGGARVTFYETVNASGEIPYAIDGTAVDPLTRRLPGDAFALATGSLVVGTYASGGTITFSSAAPLEGAGGYVLGSEGLYRTDTLAAIPTVVTGTAAVPTMALAPFPGVAAGGVPGTLTIAITAPVGQYDSGFLIVSVGNRVVETLNVASALDAGTGNVTVSGLPGGSALAASAGVPYQVAIRAWNSTDPTTTFVRVAGSTSASLGDSGVASTSVTVP